MENGKEDENYLPDLPDEKSGEQIVFDQKVFRCNEEFVKKTERFDIMVQVSSRVSTLS